MVKAIQLSLAKGSAMNVINTKLKMKQSDTFQLLIYSRYLNYNVLNSHVNKYILINVAVKSVRGKFSLDFELKRHDASFH